MTTMDFDVQSVASTTAPERAQGEILDAIEGTSWTARAKGAERLARLYCAGNLGPAARRGAEDAFRVLRFDSEALIRRLIAECLKDAADLPRDIAMQIATDRADIAALFLECSPALADADLIAIAREHPGPHRLAVARRRRPISPELCEILCRSGDLAVQLAVLANDAAEIAEATLHDLLDPPLDGALQEAIARRRLLPIGIVGRLRIRADRARPYAEPPRPDTHRRRAAI
jgi:uncharacterized protein (DUF2336 family)